MNIEELNSLSNSNINNRLEETYDDLEQEKKKVEEEMEEMDELELTNKFKTRIIDSEINSNLRLQILIYFNACYFIVCFALEISSISFQLYIYNDHPLLWINFALELAWLIIEPIKVYNGYLGNITENVNNKKYNFIQFYNLLIFFITTIFGIAIQIVSLIDTSIRFPIQNACVIVYCLISLIELIICIYTFYYIGKRQGAIFNLRNSSVSNKNTREKIKTSQEIEQELFYKFPYLQKGNKNKSNDHIKNN